MRHEVSGTTISSEGGRSTVPHPTPTPAETSAPSRDVGAGTSAPVNGTTESRPIHTDAVASEIRQGAHKQTLALRGDTADVELRAPTVDLDDLNNREGNALTEEIVAKTQDGDLFVKGKMWIPI